VTGALAQVAMHHQADSLQASRAGEGGREGGRERNGLVSGVLGQKLKVPA
jgi:hypothetical protein